MILKKENFCKHILFIYLKVLKLKRKELVYQTALLAEELKEIFAEAPQDPSSNVIADKQVQEKYQEIINGKTPSEIPQVTQKQIEPDDTCPVCYDSMSINEVLVYCKVSCGKSLHADCFKEWARAKNGKPTCVYCRAEWLGEVSNKKINAPLMNEGYLNLAQYQHDVIKERDTSSYAEWYTGSYYNMY